MIYTYPDGVKVDLTTGEVVGQGEPAKVTPAQARVPETLDISEPTAAGTAASALKQLSFGFNSALFALPDTVIKAVGKAAGVSEEEIPTFVGYFNRGQTVPKNAIERFANAIGQGAGATVPYSGLLGAVARTKALTTPLTPGAPITKQIAKETLDFIRQNPRAAVALDLGFGAAYGAAEQAVEETMPAGAGRDFARATVPFAATVALPLAGAKLLSLAAGLAKMSPTIRVARAVPEMFGEQTAQGYAQEVARETMPNVPFLGGPLRWAGTKFASKAEDKVTRVLSPLFAEPGKAPPGVAEALMVTRTIEQDPRLANMFLFTAGEQTLYAPLIKAQNDLVRELAGGQLSLEQARYGQNIVSFKNAFDLFAPKAKMPVEDAIRLTYAQATKTLDDAVKRVATITDDESLRIADAFVPQNLDELGDNLRRSVLAQMEGQFIKLKNLAQERGMRTGFDVEGVRVPVRVEGEPTLPAVDFRKFADEFNSRFKLKPGQERFFPEDIPSPVSLIDRERNRLTSAIEEKYNEILPQLLKEKLLKDPFVSRLAPEDQDLVAKNLVERILTGKTGPARPRVPRAEDLAMVGVRGPDEKEVKILVSQARKMAEEQVDFSITQPEALDLLERALKYRNSSILRANKEMDLGMPRRNAEAILDRGNAVLRDVEDFVFKAFKDSPQMKDFMFEYKDTYSKGYEKLFPLMITKRAPGGEFYVSNEKVIGNALSSAENIRNLNAIFGDNREYIDTMTKVMMDKAAKANILKDGVMNVPAYERFLSNNRNIIEAMPSPVQTTLKDELKFGREFAARKAEMDDRIELVKDDELFKLLQKSVRPDADPRDLIERSITDPAVMRKLVGTVGSDPERMSSLRRQVWSNVKENILDQTRPGYLAEFIERNGKSLNILYSPEQMKDLRTIAEIQRRVFIANEPSGVLSPFQSVDEMLRQKIGAGIGTIESTARAAAIRQISPFHAITTLLSRLVGRQQTAIYEKILYKALTDPEYAHQLAKANVPLDSKEGKKAADAAVYKAGGFLNDILRNAPRVGAIEAIQALQEEKPLPVSRPEITVPGTSLPVPPRIPVPEMPAQAKPRDFLQASEEMMRAGRRPPAPPAPSRAAPAMPPTRGVPQMPAPPAQQGAAPSSEMYRLLFPTDTIAPLMEQRQAQQRNIP